MALKRVIGKLLIASFDGEARLYSADTWQQLRNAVELTTSKHRQIVLPHDVEEIKRVRDDADQAIRVLDALGNCLLDTAREISCAVTSVTLEADTTKLPNGRGRPEQVAAYLTRSQFADLEAGTCISSLALEKLQKCRNWISMQEHTNRELNRCIGLLSASLLTIMATVIRFGLIATLSDLHRRVCIVHEVLRGADYVLEQPKSRGRPVNPANVARDIRLLQLQDELTRQGKRDTAQPLFNVAKLDPIILELQQFRLPPLTKEICREAIRPSRTAKKRLRPGI